MSAYQFEMADDETHARVICAGKLVGTIQNDAFGNVNFGQQCGAGGSLHYVGPTMWDEFEAWWDSRSATQSSTDQSGAMADTQGEA